MNNANDIESLKRRTVKKILMYSYAIKIISLKRMSSMDKEIMKIF